MTKKRNGKETKSLRNLAEKRLKDLPIQTAFPGKKAEIRKLIHELQVHHVELQMQNDELITARDRLEDLMTQFAIHYDLAPSGTFTVDREGVISEANIRGVAMLRGDMSSLHGKNLLRFITRDTQSTFRKFLDDVFETNAQKACDVSVYDSGINRRFWHIDGISIENKGKCLLVAADISDLKSMQDELAASHARLEKKIEELNVTRSELLEAQKLAHVGNWEMNLDTGRSSWSEELYNIFGVGTARPPYNYVELLNLFTRESANLLDTAIRKSSETSEPFELELEFIRRNGEHRIIFVKTAVVQTAQQRGVIMRGIIQDITDRKRAEATILKNLAELERSNTDLEQFAYVVSHDLREPLRMISGYMALLARKYKDGLDEEANDFIKQAVDGAARLQALISGLLLYSRAGREPVPFKATDCNEVLNQVLLDIHSRLEESGADIKSSSLPTVLGDRTQLLQLFQNLIINAIKFHGENKPVIRISASMNTVDWVFSVSDNGIGIIPENRDRIFLIFQRGRSLEQYEGLGIGLAICKKIVERHGGKIWVESVPAQGSTFFFTLPKSEG